MSLPFHPFLPTAMQRVNAAIAALQRHELILVQDDPERENEADLIGAAQTLRIAQMATLIRDGSGIVCLCLDAAKAHALRLGPMVSHNRSRYGTAFTASIEATTGVTTGVSAADRVTTIRAALASTPDQSQIVSPGHVFPLVARHGGVQERRGHTEAAIDLVQRAGFMPAAVLCELMQPDGSMAHGAQVTDYALRHRLSIVTVDDLVHIPAASKPAEPRLRPAPTTATAPTARPTMHRA